MMRSPDLVCSLARVSWRPSNMSDEDDEPLRRPLNGALSAPAISLTKVAFFLYRSVSALRQSDLGSTAKAAEYRAANEGEQRVSTQRNLSRIIADEWHSEPEDVRAAFKQEAELRHLEYKAAQAGASRGCNSALTRCAEQTATAKRRIAINLYDEGGARSAAPSPSPKRTRPALERSGWSDPSAITPAHRSPDRLRIVTSGYGTQSRSPYNTAETSPQSAGMALPPNWPEPPRPLGWDLVDHGRVSRRTSRSTLHSPNSVPPSPVVPSPIVPQSPADLLGLPFVMDDALVAAAAQRFDSLDMPVDFAAAPDGAHAAAAYDGGHQYAALSPELQFPTAPSAPSSLPRHVSHSPRMPAPPIRSHSHGDVPPSWWPWRDGASRALGLV